MAAIISAQSSPTLGQAIGQFRHENPVGGEALSTFTSILNSATSDFGRAANSIWHSFKQFKQYMDQKEQTKELEQIIADKNRQLPPAEKLTLRWKGAPPGIDSTVTLLLNPKSVIDYRIPAFYTFDLQNGDGSIVCRGVMSLKAPLGGGGGGGGRRLSAVEYLQKREQRKEYLKRKQELIDGDVKTQHTNARNNANFKLSDLKDDYDSIEQVIDETEEALNKRIDEETRTQLNNMWKNAGGSECKVDGKKQGGWVFAISADPSTPSRRKVATFIEISNPTAQREAQQQQMMQQQQPGGPQQQGGPQGPYGPEGYQGDPTRKSTARPRGENAGRNKIAVYGGGGMLLLIVIAVGVLVYRQRNPNRDGKMRYHRQHPTRRGTSHAAKHSSSHGKYSSSHVPGHSSSHGKHSSSHVPGHSSHGKASHHLSHRRPHLSHARKHTSSHAGKHTSSHGGISNFSQILFSRTEHKPSSHDRKHGSHHSSHSKHLRSASVPALREKTRSKSNSGTGKHRSLSSKAKTERNTPGSSTRRKHG